VLLDPVVALSCGSSYLAVFALEILDLAFHLRQLTLQTSHVLVELLQLEC
jgi:hypothetical protein